MTKTKVLKELLKLVRNNYFESYFEDWKNPNTDDSKLIVIDFLEVRLIELEEDGKNY